MARRLPHTQGPDVVVLTKIVERPRMGLDQELTMVAGRWLADGAHTQQTLVRMSETVTRFAARLQAAGVSSFAAVTPDTARGFVTARTGEGKRPKLATMHARRTALRTLYRTLRALGIRAAAAAMAVQRQDLNIDTLANAGRPTGKRRRVMDRQSTD